MPLIFCPHDSQVFFMEAVPHHNPAADLFQVLLRDTVLKPQPSNLVLTGIIIEGFTFRGRIHLLNVAHSSGHNLFVFCFCHSNSDHTFQLHLPAMLVSMPPSSSWRMKMLDRWSSMGHIWSPTFLGRNIKSEHLILQTSKQA